MVQSRVWAIHWNSRREAANTKKEWCAKRRVSLAIYVGSEFDDFKKAECQAPPTNSATIPCLTWDFWTPGEYYHPYCPWNKLPSRQPTCQSHTWCGTTTLQILMGFIKSLISFWGSKSKRPAIMQSSPFMELPLDTIHLILDHLLLSEKLLLLLFQTCRRLWYTLRSRCFSTFWTASPEQRLECLTRLGDILPDYRSCTFCRALHPVDPEDLPTAWFNTFYETCPAPDGFDDRHWITPRYAIAFRHVHLAMKYSRIQNSHQDYREKLLQKFWRSCDDDSNRLEFTTQPVIANDHFILMTKFELHERLNPISLSAVHDSPACSSPRLVRDAPYYSDEPFYLAMQSAFDEAASRDNLKPQDFSYDCCTTDVSISIRSRKVTIVTWQDLGPGTTPTEPYWCSHIYGADNDAYTGNRFDYEHGSIRRLYCSGDTSLSFDW